MSGFDVFRIHRPIRFHFTSDYDFFRYNGKCQGIQRRHYETSKDKYQYDKIAKELNTDFASFIIYCVSRTPDMWIGCFLDEHLDSFHPWLSFLNSFEDSVVEEVRCLLWDVLVVRRESFDFLLETSKNTHSFLLNRMFSGKVSVETFCVLDEIFDLSKEYNNSLKNDPVWASASMRIKKYRPFLPNHDTKQIQRRIYEIYNQYT